MIIKNKLTQQKRPELLTERDFLNDMWEDLSGKKFPKPKKMPSYEELVKSERCDQVDKLCNNRLVMGAFRYVPLAEKNFDNYDLIAESKKRIELASEHDSLDYLLDAINMLRLKVRWELKKGKSLNSIDDGWHSQKINETPVFIIVNSFTGSLEDIIFADGVYVEFKGKIIYREDWDDISDMGQVKAIVREYAESNKIDRYDIKYEDREDYYEIFK